MKTILVVGATGQTGKLVVEKSLANDHKVRVIVRSRNRLPSEILEHPNITLVEANVLDLMDEQMADLVKECDAVVSCLGHVISFQGIFGEPKLLCTEATKRLCKAIESNRPTSPVKFILMNTVGVSNPDLREQREWFERVVLTLLSWLIPPHKDNEMAAQHLHANIGPENKYVEWCSVRPDSLINDVVSAYEIAESPSTSLFNGQPTARSNVAHFMVQLIEDNSLWKSWRFRMPVIMNSKVNLNAG